MKINENEIWKPIPWTKGIYYASNCGRIKSVDRVIKQFNNGVYAYHHYKGRMLKLKKNSRGYEKVSLNVLGICYSNRMVHNLVCEAFYGEIPEGYEVQIRPRSGLSLNTPLRVCNAPGTIDAGYRDEICVIMQNTSERFYTDGIGKIKVLPDIDKNHYDCSTKGNKKGWYHIHKGDRIAQFVLQEVPHIVWKECNNVAFIGEDRNGGFGSTGTKSVKILKQNHYIFF